MGVIWVASHVFCVPNICLRCGGCVWNAGAASRRGAGVGGAFFLFPAVRENSGLSWLCLECNYWYRIIFIENSIFCLYFEHANTGRERWVRFVSSIPGSHRYVHFCPSTAPALVLLLL